MKSMTIPYSENVSFLLGIESDGFVDIKNSYLAAIANDMKNILPRLIEVNEDDADVSEAIVVIGMAASCFQKIIKELS